MKECDLCLSNIVCINLGTHDKEKRPLLVKTLGCKGGQFCGRLYTRSASLWRVSASVSEESLTLYSRGDVPCRVLRWITLTAVGALVDFGARGFTKLRVRPACSETQQAGLLVCFHPRCGGPIQLAVAPSDHGKRPNHAAGFSY